MSTAPRAGSSSRRFFGGLVAALLVGCAAGTSTNEGVGDTGIGSPDSGGDVTIHHEHDAGHEAGATCVAPQSACGNVCTNLTIDPSNCGKCGHGCGANMVCNAGACSSSCSQNSIKCPNDGGGLPKFDAAALDAGGHDAGKDAPATFDAATDAVSDAQVEDAAHDAARPDSASPVDAAKPFDAGSGLDAGSNPMGEYCADPSSDRLNCGGCNIICPYGPNSTPVCNEGRCGVTCAAGYSDCDMNPDNGCETQTGSNPGACGACGNVCPGMNSIPSCTNGTCGLGTCAPGFEDCDGNPANGCEVNTTTTTNCGTCGNVCPSGPNSTPVCTVVGTAPGVCGITCTAGYADCDHNATDGCEVNTTSNIGNCGTCGNACNLPNAVPGCSNGSCVIASCNAGFANCDMLTPDGCETNLNTDPGNCSACGTQCVTANGMPACVDGTCAAGMCNMGFANCMGDGTNCSTNIDNNPSDCGSCGNQCNLPNTATDTCTNGTCTVGTCQVGFANCTSPLDPTAGCNTSTTTVADCGGCGIECTTGSGTPSCKDVGGTYTCAVGTCATGFANCPGDGNNCSTNTDTDDNNCGFCGNSCETACGGPAANVTGTTCSNGQCEVTGCSTGFIDFNNTCGGPTGGCQCRASTTSGSCVNATEMAAAALTQGQTPSPIVSTMAPFPAVSEAFFTVTFTENNSNNLFHPKLTITSLNNEFIFDVTSNCNGGYLLNCDTAGDVGSASGVTTWEMHYTAGDPVSYPVTGDHFDPIALPGANGQVWVRVYRRAGATPTCNDYTLTVSE